MLLHWTLVALLPYLAIAVPLSEFLLPEGGERDVSPAEDPPPAIPKQQRKLIPSIERLQIYESRNDVDHDIEDLPYHPDELPNNPEMFAARRRNLQQPTFTVESRGKHRDSTDEETRSPRRHKAFNFPPVAMVSGVGHTSRSKRGASSPAVDAVDENPAQWRRFDNTKPQFVTSRTQPATTSTRAYYSGVPQHRVSHSMDEADTHSSRYNEIPVQQQRYPTNYIREPVDYRREGDAPRRIIYYANLPEDTRRPLDPVDYHRDRYDDRYDYGRSFNKYPRESRYEDVPPRSQVNRDDRYRYNPSGNGGSYSIVDAERPPPLPSRNEYPSGPSQQYAFRDPDTMTRYNRIPAPYQQSQGRYAYDQRRGPAPLPSPPTSALHPSRYSPYSRSGNSPRNQLTVTPATPALGDEPYRDYNPRQPAPWSLQIGTKLTVKDDGRPMPSPGGQRFYVQSQQQQYPTRYLRSEDDPDTRQM